MAWAILSTINLTGQRIDAPAWGSATFYRFGTLVTYGGKHFTCMAAHTSGTFATDLASFLWTEQTVVDSIAFNAYLNPEYIDTLRVRKNGVELTRDANHIYLDVRHDFANGRTTGYVCTRQALVNGDQIVIYHETSYYEYVSTKFPAIEGRVGTLEGKLAGITSVQTALNTRDSRITNVENALPPLQTQITNNRIPLDQAVIDIANLKPRVTALELKVANLEKFTDTKGRITVLNNQLVPIEIPELAIDGNVHSSVRIDYEIQRYTGTEYRSSTGTLHFCLKQNGVWMTDRNIVSFDVDGITFSINTVLSKQGKVFYTTDEVLGASYVGVFKFRRYVFEV